MAEVGVGGAAQRGWEKSKLSIWTTLVGSSLASSLGAQRPGRLRSPVAIRALVTPSTRKFAAC